MAVAREKLRLLRAKKRDARIAKDEAYATFIRNREAEQRREEGVTIDQVDTELVQPEAVMEREAIREKIRVRSTTTMGAQKVRTKKLSKSALLPSEGRSMGMDVE
jgi:hypothetical protein